jgi:hypothetical protein
MPRFPCSFRANGVEGVDGCVVGGSAVVVVDVTKVVVVVVGASVVDARNWHT